MNIEKIEREDFQKLNELLAKAILGAKDDSTKERLHNVADYAAEIHKNYKSSDDEVWNKCKTGLYDCVSVILKDNFLDELTRADIKVQVDKYVDMLDYGRNQKTEKAQEQMVEERKPVINVERISITIEDIKRFIDSFEDGIDLDAIYDELSENEELKLEEVFNQYKKEGSIYHIKDDELKDYLLLKLSTENWLKAMNQEHLSSYMINRRNNYDEYSISNIKEQKREDARNMNDYDFEVTNDWENGRDRHPSYYSSKYDMNHENRLYKKFNKNMEEIYSAIEKNKGIGTR